MKKVERMSQPKEDIYENQKRKGTNGCEACFGVDDKSVSAEKITKSKKDHPLGNHDPKFFALRKWFLGRKQQEPMRSHQ